MLAAIAVLALLAAACDTGDGTTLKQPDTEAVAPLPDAGEDVVLPEGGFAIASPAFDDQGLIPPRYSLNDGSNVSPPLSWGSPPEGTAELALVVTDVAEGGAVHWVLAGLDPTSVGIEEGQVPPGAIQGLNDFSVQGWTGPAPVDGTLHTYLFTLYALAEPVDLPDGSAAADLLTRIDAVTIAITQVAGLYE
ncbi:MAG: YbhB/YbcL family Raf kinase inhibitor-like protein [Actinomycetota bacterium]